MAMHQQEQAALPGEFKMLVCSSVAKVGAGAHTSETTLQTADTLPLWVWALKKHLSGECGLHKVCTVHWHSECGPLDFT